MNTIENKINDFEKKLRQQQFELELKHTFPYIEVNGRWLDKRGTLAVSPVTSTELAYL
jgi:hypothetical protein